LTFWCGTTGGPRSRSPGKCLSPRRALRDEDALAARWSACYHKGKGVALCWSSNGLHQDDSRLHERTPQVRRMQDASGLNSTSNSHLDYIGSREQSRIAAAPNNRSLPNFSPAGNIYGWPVPQKSIHGVNRGGESPRY
jgi:hypothetical protein